eukprot:jgi/Psemu1/14480/gm1.14480_g
MENGVNDDNCPLPSPPNTTGLAWNEATSLFVNTGDLSPVTAGMFLSLAAEGDNTTSTNASVSPDRALLIQRYRTIENLSIASPRKQIFKNAVSSAYERIGQCFALKVNIVGDCACAGDKTRNGRGVSSQDALVLNFVMKDNPKLKPKAMAGEVLKALVQEESPLVASPELRSMLANKLKNKIKRQFTRERMLGTRSSNLEDNLKQWESCLFDEGYLPVAPCDGIPNCRSQAYNLMTILHSSNSMPPNNASNSEKNLYEHLQKLQGQSKRSDDQVWDKIVCFSSLSLLYNVVQCQTLGYQVTASADGFHGTCSNDWHVLTFGIFAPKEDGSRSYRPFCFIPCPSEKEIYFTAGLLVLVRFINGLFGVRDLNFKGGIVTNHAEVFVTPCTVAFPFSVNLQCFPHIHQKFLIGKANISNFYIKFSQYCSLVDKQIDIRTATEGTPIWYLNSKDSLGKMKSVAGTNSHLFVHTQRHLYIDLVHSLCKVKCSRMGVCSDGRIQRFYEGLCVAYLESRCCVHAAYLHRLRRTKIGREVGYKGEFIQLLNQTGTNMHNATKCLINNSVKNNFMHSIANNPAILTLFVKFNIQQRNRSFVDKHMSLAKEALKHICDIADVATQMVSNPRSKYIAVTVINRATIQ